MRWGPRRKPRCLPLQKIVGLPVGQDFAFDQFVGQGAGVFRLWPFAAEFRHQREHLAVRHQTTLPEEIQERIDGHVGCHGRAET